jgi:hypothetical protein
MSDLSGNELAMLEGGDPDCECMFCRATAEIRRHRAMVNRLEAWADELDAKRNGHFIAAELRERMGGDHG